MEPAASPTLGGVYSMTLSVLDRKRGRAANAGTEEGRLTGEDVLSPSAVAATVATDGGVSGAAAAAAAAVVGSSLRVVEKLSGGDF